MPVLQVVLDVGYCCRLSSLVCVFFAHVSPDKMAKQHLNQFGVCTRGCKEPDIQQEGAL